MPLLSDEQLAALSIEERNDYLENWVENINEPVWAIDEDEEEARLDAEHREELSRDRWTY